MVHPLWPLLAAAIALAGCSSPPSLVAAPTAVMVCPEGQLASRQGGCESAPPPPSSSAPRPLLAASAEPIRPSAVGGGIGALRGSWMGEDSHGSASYELFVDGGGHFRQTITTLDPNAGRSPGSCEQEGRLRIDEGKLFWYYDRNSCNTSYEGVEDPDELVEQDARHFVVQMSGYQIHYTRQR